VFGIPRDEWGETPMAVCQVARLGEVSLEEIAGLIRLAEAKQRATKDALSYVACRDDCTMLRNNQVQSADLGATFVVVRCRGRALNDAATRSGGASPYSVVRCRGRLPSAEIICSMISGGVSSP
jgi:hypothetical protein